MKNKGLALTLKLAAAMLCLLFCLPMCSVEAEAAVNQIRISGDTRYATSDAAVSKYLSLKGRSNTDILFLASGQSFPDALTGNSLASQKGAPVLLCNPGNVDNSISRIKRFLRSGGTLYILGGEAAIPASIESQMAAQGYKVIRLAGETRYATNLAILRAAFGDEGASLNKASAEVIESDLQMAPENTEVPEDESHGQNLEAADASDPAEPENATTEEQAPVADESQDLNQIKAAESDVESTDDSAADSTDDSMASDDAENADLPESEDGSAAESIPEDIGTIAAPVTEELNGLSNIPKLLVCSGENFPDALAASATGLPILAVNNKALSEDQVSFLQTHPISQMYVIGGTAVVTDALVDQIRPYVTGSVERISGSNRYETSTAVARYFFGNNVAKLAIAAGNNFPDALSAAQITSYLNMPLVLANHRGVTAGHAYIGSNLREMYIFGGAAALSDWNIRQLLGQVPIGNAIEILGDNRSGGQTLKNLLQNALIPAGRTLYVYGGGWNDDASQIGYQKSWANFFNTYAYNNYNRKNFEYTSWNGVDCSGYIGWVVYNTKYTRSNQASILYGNGTSHTAVKLAKRVADLGYASYMGQRVNSFSQLRPGDMVSMSGHIWMCMGTCSDGSALIIHSSPMGQTYGGGVQLCGSPSSSGNTNSQSYQLAQKYNQYYFEYWPYPTLNVGTNYLSSSVGYCRWNNDPDGIRNMSAEQVMATILGPL